MVCGRWEVCFALRSCRRFFVLPQLKFNKGKKIARLGITSKLPHIRNPEEINIY